MASTHITILLDFECIRATSFLGSDLVDILGYFCLYRNNFSEEEASKNKISFTSISFVLFLVRHQDTEGKITAVY